MSAVSLHRSRRVSNVLVGAALFAALAPAIALVVALMTLPLSSLFEGPAIEPSDGMTAGKLIFLFVFFLQIAYMISAAPAALAGACAGHLRHRLHAPGTWFAIGALQMTLTVSLIMLTGHLLPVDSSDMALMPPAFIAGTSCAWLLGRMFAWRDRHRGGNVPSPPEH